MNGAKNGVAKQISTDGPRAVYTHCYGHEQYSISILPTRLSEYLDYPNASPSLFINAYVNKQSRLSERFVWSKLHVVWIIKDPVYMLPLITSASEGNEVILGRDTVGAV